MTEASGRRTPREGGSLDPAGTFGLVVLLGIVVASVVAFWPSRPSAPTKVTSKGGGPTATLERRPPPVGETITLHLSDTTRGREHALVRSVTLETVPAAATFWGGASAPNEPDRLGCRLTRVAAPTLEPDGGPGVRVDVAGPLDDDADAGTGLGWELARTGCSFRLTRDGAIHSIVLLTPDELTADEDEDGDGLVVSEGAWPVDIRTALRLASVPFPSEALGVGAQWTFDEDTVLDHFKVHRHVAYKLAAWTERGASVEVDVEEVAPEQDYDPGAAAGAAFSRLVRRETGLPVGPTPLEGLPVSHLEQAKLRAHGVLQVARDATFPEGELTVQASHVVAVSPPERVKDGGRVVHRGANEHVFRYTRTPDAPR